MAERGLGPSLGYFTAIVEIGVLKTFIDFKVFDAIPDEGDISLSVVAEKVGGELEVLERFSKYLVAADILTSSTPGFVAHTAKSRTYRSSEIPAGFLVHVFNIVFRPMAHLQTYFEQHGFTSPKHANITPFGLSTGHPDLSFYRILDAEPALGKVFNSFISRAGGLWPLNGVYDFSWMKEKQDILAGERPIIVDIGGSNGFALRDILGDNIFIPAERCAIFDLPKSIENTKGSLDASVPAVQLVGGNIFEPFPTPVRSAVVYQFRRILNDYPDEDVLRAWQNVREAAAPDTRVYIVEELLQEKWTTFSAAQDVSFVMVGGKRRNAHMHSKLAGTAGFHLSSQFQDKVNRCGVLEFVLV